MVISADTSFLFSLYGNDSHSPSAIDWTLLNRDRITVTSLNRFELLNSLRFAECRKSIGPGDAARYTSLFEIDLSSGRLFLISRDLAEVIREANRLSFAHTLTGGHRSFDILHVAAAKLTKTTHFLTFDANQKRLAENEGLIVPF